MHLENLFLANFRNYREANVRFKPGINAIVGDNGSGKTNLLDALHILSMSKSALSPVDQQCIMHGQEFYSIVGKFQVDGKQHVVANSLQIGKRKRLTVNDNPVEKVANHIGEFPVVLIAPGDHDLIMDGSEARRRFIDSVISQYNRTYLSSLIEYNLALKQRNQLLKEFAGLGKTDHDLLAPYTYILIKRGLEICHGRSAFCDRFIEKIDRHYTYLSGGREVMLMIYQSDFLKDDPEKQFSSSLEKDLILQRTNVGVHRDDFQFEMDGFPLRRFGSQGQQKSFIVALKLAQFDIIHEEKGFKPILLLDDIFDKLDDKRIQKLTEMIRHHEFGQVFITDARPERSRHFIEKLETDWLQITVNSGTLNIELQ